MALLSRCSRRWLRPGAGPGAVVLAASAALAQPRPYIGFVYPAGGQQGATFQIKLGGQNLEGVDRVLVTGAGVSARVLEYDRTLGAQEITLLNEQIKALKRAATNAAARGRSAGESSTNAAAAPAQGDAPAKLIARLEKRVAQTVNRPASAALAAIVYAEVALAPDAPPGQRELRLCARRGVSNPLVFEVGQLPEFSRKPMMTASLQVLGKEELALRKRPAEEVEDRVTVPCTLNGQIAAGEINRYRFTARAGQRLVITTRARQLVPFIADAVPGWFQPVLALYDAKGKEVAYNDDYRFNPDPTIFYEVPNDGEYVLAIYDAIYRGREDFVYRISLGELPFVTSLFPLGARAGAPAHVRLKGWNLGASVLKLRAPEGGPGLYCITATNRGLLSRPLPFARDSLPETREREPNNSIAQAQKVTLPIIINGRVDRPGDWDVFRFKGKSNDTVVAEVSARRLDSPLDSILKLTDAAGRVLAYNDDYEDLAAGINTHHADSWLMARLPADGTYYVHLGDTARQGGEEYAYRLRLSAPQPDFALRVVPSSISLRSKSAAPVSVYAIRKDAFTGPIKLALKDPPAGFSAAPVSLSGTQTVARFVIKTDLVATKEPVNLTVIGTATIQAQTVTHEAVPAEDRMQAFLWRHLVPAADFKAIVFDPSYQPPPLRVAPVRRQAEVDRKMALNSTNAKPALTSADAKAVRPSTNSPPGAASTNSQSVRVFADAKPAPTAADAKPAVASADTSANKPKFTKQQVAARLRQLKLLYEEGLLTEDFYDEKVAECETAQ
jgi:hypothetical protein